MFYYLYYKYKMNIFVFIINTISVDYLDPLNFRCNTLTLSPKGKKVVCYVVTKRSLKDSDYQAHFTAAINMLLP